MVVSRRLLALAGAALLSLSASPASSQDGQAAQPPPQPAARPVLDVGKRAFVEPAVKDIVAKTATPAPAVPPAPAVVPYAPPNGHAITFVPPNGGYPQTITSTFPRIDIGKGGVIEPRIRQFVQTASAAAPAPATPTAPTPPTPARTDPGKRLVIEPTVREVVRNVSAPATPAPAQEFVNPKVEPGKVKWHANFADAQAAAKKSRKPILAFQMMGKLDDQFC